MKKNNPLYISTTNGAYDFIDFTQPQPINQNQTLELLKDLPSEPSKISQKLPIQQTFEKQYPSLTNSLFTPLNESKLKINILEDSTNQSPLCKTDCRNFRFEEKSFKKQESPYSNTENLWFSCPGQKTGNEFTQDMLLDLMVEPYRSNIRALKMKPRNSSQWRD